CLCVFFFQAEDGIRDRNVTGVQTCALPILDLPGLGDRAGQFATEDGERLGGGDVRIHPHGFDDGQFVLRLDPEIGAHPPHTSFGSCPARASFCPASIWAGMAPIFSVSRSAASTWSGTG